MPFLNLEWTSNRIQFFGEVDLFSVLSGLLYRNEWSSISGILIYIVNLVLKSLHIANLVAKNAIYSKFSI